MLWSFVSYLRIVFLYKAHANINFSYFTLGTVVIISLADIPIAPAHEQFSSAINQTAIKSDSGIIAALDYLEFATDPPIPSGVNLDSSDCPFAINDIGSNKSSLATYLIETLLTLSTNRR